VSAALLAGLFGGCGRVGYEELGDLAGPAADAGCQLSAFSAPQLLSGAVNTAGSEFSPTLSADELELYFHANPDGGGGLGSDDIWIARRSSLDLPFGTAALVMEVSSVDADGAPFLSHDGLTLVLSSSRPGGVGSNDIWLATRASPGGAFSEPVNVTTVNSGESETGPFLSADGLTLYFGSTRAGGPAATNIWAATRANLDADFGQPALVGGLDIGGSVEAPSLSDDELTIYFDGFVGAGSTELYVATRADKNQDFQAPSLLTAVNSVEADYSPELSADGLTLYFTSSRPGVGNDDLWLATRQCLP